MSYEQYQAQRRLRHPADFAEVEIVGEPAGDFDADIDSAFDDFDDFDGASKSVEHPVAPEGESGRDTVEAVGDAAPTPAAPEAAVSSSTVDMGAGVTDEDFDAEVTFADEPTPQPASEPVPQPPAAPTAPVSKAVSIARDTERYASITQGKRITPSSLESPDLPTPERKTLRDRLRSLLPAKKAKGPSTDGLRYIRRNLTGSFNIAVVNVKGGVGKTVTADLLGKTFSSQRNDRVIAVDATPEGGELADRCRNENQGTVRSLIEQLPLVSRYSHIREHTSQGDSGLEVLGADPSVVGAQQLTGAEYTNVMRTLRTYYQVIITDCAQGVTGPLMEAVLDETDLLVLVSEGADGMRAATKTANDLSSPEGYWQGRYAHLVDDMVVVVNSRTPRSNVDVTKVEEYFSQVARAVVTLPFDQALEGGRATELAELSAATREAGIELAAKVAASHAFKAGGR